MNKAQKEVQQTQLNDEKKVIKLLELVYEQAKKDCEQKIRELSARTDLENLQSIIYQKEYQQIMVDQIESILYDLHEGQFTTIADYLQQSYINGYVGMYYDLHLSGIPLVVPINQDQVVKAVCIPNLVKMLVTLSGQFVLNFQEGLQAVQLGMKWH